MEALSVLPVAVSNLLHVSVWLIRAMVFASAHGQTDRQTYLYEFGSTTFTMVICIASSLHELQYSGARRYLPNA